MDPLHAINQEFARIVVQEWSEHAPTRQRRATGSKLRSRTGRVVRSLLTWAVVRISPQPETTLTALGPDAARH